MTEVTTERLLLRPLRDDDLDAYHARIYGDPAVMRTLPSGQPISRERFDERVPAWMRDHWAEHGFGPWVMVERASGEPIGHCGLKYWPGTSDVEVFYALARSHWGRGLASEGAQASLAYGFERLGLERIIAGALVSNAASRRVLEKLGMRCTGEGEWSGLHTAWYAIERAAYRPGGRRATG